MNHINCYLPLASSVWGRSKLHMYTSPRSQPHWISAVTGDFFRGPIQNLFFWSKTWCNRQLTCRLPIAPANIYIYSNIPQLLLGRVFFSRSENKCLQPKLFCVFFLSVFSVCQPQKHLQVKVNQARFTIHLHCLIFWICLTYVSLTSCLVLPHFVYRSFSTQASPKTTK